jgi:hypothetical protein
LGRYGCEDEKYHIGKRNGDTGSSPVSATRDEKYHIGKRDPRSVKKKRLWTGVAPDFLTEERPRDREKRPESLRASMKGSTRSRGTSQGDEEKRPKTLRASMKGHSVMPDQILKESGV